MIATNGNVGIGTTTPQTTLQVAGNSTFNGVVSVTNSVMVDVTAQNNGAIFGTPGLVFGGSGSGEGMASKRNAGGNQFGLDLYTGYSPRLSVASSGNVGINTTTPGTEKLVVAGGMDVTAAASSPGGDAGLGLSFESYGGRIQSFQNKPLLLNPVGNNVGIGKTTAATALDVNGDITCVAINITSDRNAKEAFQAISAREVLAKVIALPISEWQYKGGQARDGVSRHLGPMAQDFYASFGLGDDDRTFHSVDAHGVALAAIQALERVVTQQEQRIERLERENRALGQRLRGRPR
jgi:hypothetical protein